MWPTLALTLTDLTWSYFSFDLTLHLAFNLRIEIRPVWNGAPLLSTRVQLQHVLKSVSVINCGIRVWFLSYIVLYMIFFCRGNWRKKWWFKAPAAVIRAEGSSSSRALSKSNNAGGYGCVSVEREPRTKSCNDTAGMFGRARVSVRPASQMHSVWGINSATHCCWYGYIVVFLLHPNTPSLAATSITRSLPNTHAICSNAVASSSLPLSAKTCSHFIMMESNIIPTAHISMAQLRKPQHQH